MLNVLVFNAHFSNPNERILIILLIFGTWEFGKLLLLLENCIFEKLYVWKNGLFRKLFLNKFGTWKKAT